MNDACRLRITIESADIADDSHANHVACRVHDATACTDTVRVEHHRPNSVQSYGPTPADVVIKVTYKGPLP